MRIVSTVRTGSACLALACLLAAAPRAEEYYVAPDSDDANAGTMEKPFKDPVAAAAKLMPGDTLFFRAGEYKVRKNRVVGLAPARSGEEGKPITFKNYRDEHVKLDFKGSDWGLTSNGFSWIAFDGFEMTNPSGYVAKFAANSSDGKTTGEHVTIRNCELHHTGGRYECIFVWKTPWTTIENCHMHDSNESHGIYINQGCDHIVIRNVTSENNRGNSGIQINAAGGGTRDGLVERCLLRGCAHGFSLMGAVNCTFRNNVLFNNGYDGPRGSGSREMIMWTYNEQKDKPGVICEGNVFENNTFVNLVPEGHKMNHLVQTSAGTKNCTFRNNIFVIRGLPVFSLGNFEGFAFENNCLWRIGGGEEVSKGGTLADFCKAKGLKESGSISKDPTFVDAEKGALHLKPGSPCLGAGTAKDGKPRDIGALQRGEEIQFGCKLPWKKAAEAK